MNASLPESDEYPLAVGRALDETAPKPSRIPSRAEVVISDDEACAVLECSLPRLRQLIALGDIPAIQPGKAYVIPRQAFYEAINALAKREAQKRAAAANSPPPTLPPTWGPNRRIGRPPKVR
jgi:excisionase family DNA binding protein